MARGSNLEFAAVGWLFFLARGNAVLALKQGQSVQATV